MTEQQLGTILVVEDDKATRTFLADNLAADGYEPIDVDHARAALGMLETRFPDAAILDIGLEGGPSGLDLLTAIRGADGVAGKINSALPVLVLSGRADELDRLRAFERGADDFLPKPFSYAELRARLAALLRRAEHAASPGRLRVGALELDPASRTVTVSGIPVELSQKEYALLRALAAAPTRVFTKQELLKTIWGYRSIGTTRTLDSHACRLRGKLAVGDRRFVVNVWGVGYRLVDAVVPPADALGPAASPRLAVGA
ncbi:MAG TPA: response regulator transcription factor [Baekduia sp.]|nr:response regulator transcription factor [Baekduia sp.]